MTKIVGEHATEIVRHVTTNKRRKKIIMQNEFNDKDDNKIYLKVQDHWQIPRHCT